MAQGFSRENPNANRHGGVQGSVFPGFLLMVHGTEILVQTMNPKGSFRV